MPETARIPVTTASHAGANGAITSKCPAPATGNTLASPPAARAARAYACDCAEGTIKSAAPRTIAWLEAEMGFERSLIQTDFEFGSVEASAEACEFFFGAPYADLIRANGWARVPEWTGM